MKKSNIKIAVSSGCFMTDNLDEMVFLAKENGVENIELSANVKHLGREILLEKLKLFDDIGFLIHHYFPAPKIPFVCNIAHPDTHEASTIFIKENIDLCGKLGLSSYSVHAGYGINPSPGQLGRVQNSLTPIPYDKSLKLFVDTALELEKYGREKSVKLLWENNVVAKQNLFNTTRTPYLFSDLEFLTEMENDTWWKNANILLDIGHLKVSSKTLNFPPEEFIERIADKTVHVHFSENDGFEDTNEPISEKSFLLFRELSSFVSLEWLILEVYKISAEKIQNQIHFLEKFKVKNLKGTQSNNSFITV